MLSTGCNYGKLKTNLRLAINRLKLLEKKKTELAQKARREIADYILNGKYERAKIRVEHIIREDYIVEAMELIEMYCDLLLARFGLIQQMKVLDEGLAEAISSLIWAAPRLQADVTELKIIADQLSLKYGKPYAQAAKENGLHSVNEKLVHKLNVQAPAKILVEKYLIEIAKSHNINYEPDTEVLGEEENATEALADKTLIDFGDEAGGNPPEPGFVVGGCNPTPFPGVQHPPPFPDVQPLGPFPVVQHPPPKPGRPFDYPPRNKEFEAMGNGGSSSQGPPLPQNPPNDGYPGYNPNAVGFNFDTPAPPYDTVVGPGGPPLPQVGPSAPPAAKSNNKVAFPSDSLLNLPSVPNTVLPDVEDDSTHEIDFDDLTKRFEELKKRK